MLPKPETGDADLYRQLFIDLEQLEDPVRLRTLGAEAKPDTGDADLYISIIEEQDDLDSGDAALYKQLATYLL